MRKRFFVTIAAKDRHALLRLQQYDLDVFRTTAKVTERDEHVIDGLLTLEEVGRLVEDGYRVTVNREASQMARARTEIAGFEEWLEGMER